MTWKSPEPPPEPARIGVAGWLRAGLRGAGLVGLIGLGVILLAVLRLAEWPFFGLRRPVSACVNVVVSRLCLAILGIGWQRRGRPMTGRGALVANHASWLDILALNAAQRVYFVAKSEVAGWPGIGIMARASGTVFINRRGREAQVHRALFEARLRAGHRLLFFPEGTSSDGRRVLPFKSTLFAAFLADDLRDVLQVQPVTLIWHAPPGRDARFYGWWGDMALGAHLAQVLAVSRQGRVELVFHEPVAVRDLADRKALAAHCEAAVRGALTRAGRQAAG